MKLSKLSSDVLVHEDDKVIIAFKLTADEFMYRFHGVAGQLIKKLSVNSFDQESLAGIAIENMSDANETEATEFVSRLIKDLEKYEFLED